MKLFVLILFMLISYQVISQENSRFKIVENGKVGYINNQGEIVIKPDNNNGDDFSDGVAAVRKDGLYGFIDINGKYVIAPQYDYATHFYNGYGFVFKNGSPQIIDKQGNLAVPKQYKALKFISHAKAVITTKSEKKGIYDLRSKKLLTDTIFENISDFIKGSAIAKAKTNNDYYVIDSLGNTIIHPKTYREIQEFSEDGFAIVDLMDDKTQGIIDAKGKLLFSYHNEFSHLKGKFNNGYVPVEDFQWDNDGKKENVHRGYIDASGKLVFNDTTKKDFGYFSNGRAFIVNNESYNILIDTNFKQVTDSLYHMVQGLYNEKIFHGEYAIVQSSNFQWGVIDQSGRYVVKPQFDEIDECGIIDNFIFFRQYDANDIPKYGICTLQDSIILKPIIDVFDNRGFVDGLLKVIIDDKLTYIDKSGKIIWQQQPNRDVLSTLNIDFMNRGYCYAYSKTEKNNGWAMSDNYPKAIKTLKFPKKQLSLIIDEKNKSIFADEFNGCKLYLGNTTGKKIALNASDSRLNILLQAINANGNWEYIEYAPSSWCGNSYHNLYLESGEYWDFTIPTYEGSLKTKLRAVLTYREGKKEKIIYSNAIDSSVNPAQFFNKNQYYRSNIMDSYND